MALLNSYMHDNLFIIDLPMIVVDTKKKAKYNLFCRSTKNTKILLLQSNFDNLELLEYSCYISKNAPTLYFEYVRMPLGLAVKEFAKV